MWKIKSLIFGIVCLSILLLGGAGGKYQDLGMKITYNIEEILVKDGYCNRIYDRKGSYQDNDCAEKEIISCYSEDTVFISLYKVRSLKTLKKIIGLISKEYNRHNDKDMIILFTAYKSTMEEHRNRGILTQLKSKFFYDPDVLMKVKFERKTK